jgi:nitric oxide reductase large subunit
MVGLPLNTKTTTMKTNKYSFYFISIGLISLLLGLLAGLLAGFQYVIPSFIKETLPFTVLRPLHTLFVISWIFLAAIGRANAFKNLYKLKKIDILLV